MIKLQESPRIKEIEDRLSCRMDDFLYQLHLGDNMMHKEIAEIVNVPRPTITRWFHQLDIPTQSCRRFTDKNLTSWLYKTGQLKKKPAYNGPDRRIQSTKGGLNVDFFKTWSSSMAYVLGYFSAGGCMYKNSGKSKYFNFVSTDYELLHKVKIILQSKHRIVLKKRTNTNRKDIYWLQIGSKDIYDDLLKLGLTSNKDKSIKFPSVPDEHLNHFVRGYFDGDGCVAYGYYKRKNRHNKQYLYFQTKFACGNKKFLVNLSNKLVDVAILGNGSIGRSGSSWQLSYSKKDSVKLFYYMYGNVNKDRFLERKYKKFKRALKVCGGVA
jgi:hypothetical protein